MADKKFCDMTPDERLVDLRKRVHNFQMFELPGQPQGMHMGTSYLVDDLWRELRRAEGVEADTHSPLSEFRVIADPELPDDEIYLIQGSKIVGKIINLEEGP